MRKKIHVERVQAMKNKNRGKRTEKNLCKILGFERVGIFGGEDAKKGPISAEFKSRVNYAGHTMFYGQAEVNRKKANRQVSLLVVHKVREKHKNDLVHMRLEDWMEMFKFAKKAGYVKKIRNK